MEVVRAISPKSISPRPCPHFAGIGPVPHEWALLEFNLSVGANFSELGRICLELALLPLTTVSEATRPFARFGVAPCRAPTSKTGRVTQGWRVQPVDHRDPLAPVEEIVRLIDVAGTATAAAYSRSDAVQALNEHQPAAVAFSSGQLVGVAIARMAGRDAHLLALALHPSLRNRGIGSALLRELDQEAIHHGALRMLALVEPGQVGEVAFAHQGFDRIDGLHFYIRSASMVPEELEIVERYGGHFPAAGLWKEIKGFSTTKELLERRIVAPLAHAEVAESVGLRAPGAVMLFGPPGTGKTSFARAIASRLSWAFVELHPSLLGQWHRGRSGSACRAGRSVARGPLGVFPRRGGRNRVSARQSTREPADRE